MWEQVAKFRAGRKLWAKNLKEKYGAQNPKSLFLRGLFGGGGYGLTKKEPENNIVRGAFYALAAALSGAQTIALCSYDEAYTIPTPHSALLSLRTLQIVMEEVGLRDTVDPLAGSYFIETLTKQMEEKILEEMERIEKMGGMAEAVEQGFVQRLVAQQAYQFEKDLQTGKLKKVGVNLYADESKVEEDVALHEYDPTVVDQQIERLKEVKSQRSEREVKDALKALETAAREGKNVMPYLVTAVKAYATVGEMTNVFRNVFGEFNEPRIV